MSATAQRAEVVSLVHLGCARNLIDSELILARLAEQELLVSGDADHAGTVVLNTCSFIGPAREESYAAIRGLLERKRAGSLQHVVVAGCLVQRYRRKLAEQFPAVDLWAEISDYRALAREVRGMVDGSRTAGYLEGPGLRPPTGRTRACCRPPAPTRTCASATAATTPAASVRSPRSAARTAASDRPRSWRRPRS